MFVCVVEDFDKWQGCEARSQRLTAAIMTISPETSALTMHIWWLFFCCFEMTSRPLETQDPPYQSDSEDPLNPQGPRPWDTRDPRDPPGQQGPSAYKIGGVDFKHKLTEYRNHRTLFRIQFPKPWICFPSGGIDGELLVQLLEIFRDFIPSIWIKGLFINCTSLDRSGPVLEMNYHGYHGGTKSFFQNWGKD